MAKKISKKKSENRATSKSNDVRVKKSVENSDIAENRSDLESPERNVISSEVKKLSGSGVKVHKITVVIALLIILIGIGLYYGRGFIVAAVVNGQPISRLSIIQETEKASGRQAMASLIRNVLVEQEARKQDLTVSESEIDKQIKTIEDNLAKQGQKLDQMLALEGITRNDLRRIIKIDLYVTKLVEKDINVTDKQVDEYIEKNSALLPQDLKEDELKKMAREQLRKEQLAQKAQAWLAELEKKANVVKFVEF
jgi:foldase protein PrsA